MESANSGIAQIVSPQTGGAGSITGSALEMSNVDLSGRVRPVDRPPEEGSRPAPGS
jgi:hypothetical protein